MQLTNLQDLDARASLETTDDLTKEQLAGALPDKRFRKHLTDEVIDIINSEPDSELRRVFRDNALTYASVLTTGRYSLAAYINAVKFVSLKLMGDLGLPHKFTPSLLSILCLELFLLWSVLDIICPEPVHNLTF